MSANLLHLIPLVARQDAGTTDAGTNADGGAGADAGANQADACAATNFSDKWGLRIGAIFVILVSTSYFLLLRMPLIRDAQDRSDEIGHITARNAIANRA